MAPPAPVACLFDLDGTILDSRRCGVTAFLVALKEIYGWDNALEGVLIAGRTDRRIFFDAFRKFAGEPPGGPSWAGEVERFKARYVFHLEAMLGEKPPLLCPGFPSLLEGVAGAAGMEPGMATGNFQGGAALKLSAAGIDIRRFAFGSFGDETESRPELVRMAGERASAHAGRPVTAVVIGDTPEDYRAAREAGARCALVATGPYRHEELAGLGPDFQARSLEDPSPFFAWLSSLRNG